MTDTELRTSGTTGGGTGPGAWAVLLPAERYEAERFRSNYGYDPYDWMRRPQNFKQLNVSSSVTAQLRVAYLLLCKSERTHGSPVEGVAGHHLKPEEHHESVQQGI